MSHIRCDNAECVLYVDELIRVCPEQFELELSTRSLGIVPDGLGEHAGAWASDAATAKGPGLASRSCTRAVTRTPSSMSHRQAIVASRAGQLCRATGVLARVARWRIAREVQILVDPYRRSMARRQVPSR